MFVIIRKFLGLLYSTLFKELWKEAKSRADSRFKKASTSSVDVSCRVVLPEKGGAAVFCEYSYAGPRVIISPPKNGRFYLGPYASINADCQLLGDIYIGASTLLASQIYASSGSHNFKENPPNLIKNQDHISSAGENISTVHIGEDCWIGRGVYIGPGISIERGSIIGANSVVTKDIPPYSIAAGIPAKVIGERLKFAPPPSIDASNTGSYPYFFTGFLQQSSHRHTALFETHSNSAEIVLFKNAAKYLILEGNFSDKLNMTISLSSRKLKLKSKSSSQFVFIFDQDKFELNFFGGYKFILAFLQDQQFALQKAYLE